MLLPLENVHSYIPVGFKAHNTELNYPFNNTYKINTIQATIFICFTCFKFNLKQFLTQTKQFASPSYIVSKLNGPHISNVNYLGEKQNTFVEVFLLLYKE